MSGGAHPARWESCFEGIRHSNNQQKIKDRQRERARVRDERQEAIQRIHWNSPGAGPRCILRMGAVRRPSLCGCTAAGKAVWGADTGAPVHLDVWTGRDSSHTHTDVEQGAAQRAAVAVVSEVNTF